MPHDGTGTGWDIALPDDGDNIPDGAKEIRDLRTGVAIRMDKEHVSLATSSAGGEHREGSAKAYYEASAPTHRPDDNGTYSDTTLDSADAGRLWIDSDDQILYHWNGSAWVQVVGIPNDSVDENAIVSTALGDGLTGGSGTVVSVNIDSAFFEFSTGQLTISAGSITATELAGSIPNSLLSTPQPVASGTFSDFATPTWDSSSNFSATITKGGTAEYSVTFTNALADATYTISYTILLSSTAARFIFVTAKTASGFTFYIGNQNAVAAESSMTSISLRIIGELA